ncbi:uncharacterized protein CLAFUR5_08047 [Fulvia fulva]|uniref:Uncharacterized protein n=1 Tax=Passalora fulva TaxID=5499 RepID=A0A9Q8P6C5_PASFU|nr:uncharacterized protein CLAFUR5_08047 [Fulvia fulva]KAK4630822.1 hypothetical protein CLAFUR0_07925 [Fulvia fulva]UJO14687.1 hypothetical protein CLAFUR5_08047 [Fulvia fulva]
MNLAFVLELELATPLDKTFRPTPQSLRTMAATRELEMSDHYPIELRYIKALFVQRQYRKCIQACRDVTKLADSRQHEPALQKTFISLYAGLAHDEVARSMHQNSITKLPCYESAEQLFMQALDALPSYEDARHQCSQTPPSDPEPVPDTASATEPYRSPSIDEPSFGDLNRLSRASSSVLSSPPIFHRHSQQSLSVRSSFFSPGASTSDTDDLESHDSFSELLTPTRLLNRDFSRISLLDIANSSLPRATSRMSLIEPPKTPQRKKSLSQGLMRPIRPGSPAKQFHIPPTLPYSGAPQRMPSRLPQLATRTKTETRLEIARVDSAMGESSFVTCPEPVSPMSQTGSDVNLSDASTVSALSPPLTPTHPARSSSVTTLGPSEPPLLDESKFLRFTDHLRAMRTQLESHIVMVQQAQDKLRQVQTERRAQRATQPARSKNTARDYFSSPAQLSPKDNSVVRLQQARSFWSFIPEDIKADEKKRRIQAGRDRGWKKERFQPGRYRDLCEKALAEL